jgi:rhodanese-related sulfurtransferase
VAENPVKLNAANRTAPQGDERFAPDGDPQVLLQRARERGKASGQPFAGVVSPPEAWALYKSGAALLIDVRTAEELKFVGRVPDAPHVAWKSGPDMATNQRFVQEVGQLADKDKVVLLLCRSGVRSAAAAYALTEAGYINAFNILEGFEGELDERQQRGTFNGWRYWGLPWVRD